MLIALLADVHANRPALEACLGAAAARGAERYAFLGDHVNYGADPEWTVDTIRDLVSKGSVALLGNHDAAVANRRHVADARVATGVAWTRRRLDPSQIEFLAGLPLTVEEDDRLFVHADANAPDEWAYVTDAEDAARSLRATRCRLTFVGHVHKPSLY